MLPILWTITAKYGNEFYSDLLWGLLQIILCLLESQLNMAFNIKLYSIRYNGEGKYTESLHFIYEDKVQH